MKRKKVRRKAKGITIKEQTRRDGSYDTLVDGGMMSFLVGSRKFGGVWESIRARYMRSLILADAKTIRKTMFPDYKAHRKVRRDGDEEKEAAYQRVKDFREYMSKDTMITLASVDGCEADDLVAIFSFIYPNATVEAIDKDLHAVPFLYNKMRTFKGEIPNPMWSKFPKYQANCKLAPWSLFLMQALRGDKSDSIPRLLPSTRAKFIWNDLYNPDDPYKTLTGFYQHYGEDLITNLNLVLIPTPWLLPADHRFNQDRSQLFKAMIDGDYWLGNHFQHIADQAIASIDKDLDPNW